MFGIKEKRGGFTLIEFMLVMAAVLIASALIAPRFLESRDTSQGREEAGKVGELKARIESYFSQEADFSGVDTALAGIAPRTFSKSKDGATVLNAWRKPITVINKPRGSAQGYEIVYEGVPRGTVCNEFVKTAKESLWPEITVGGTVITQDSNISDVMKACKIDPKKKNSSVRVVFDYWNY